MGFDSGVQIRSLSLTLWMQDLGPAQRAKPTLEWILLTAVDLAIQPFESHSTDGTRESRECEEANPLRRAKKGKDRVRVTICVSSIACFHRAMTLTSGCARRCTQSMPLVCRQSLYFTSRK